MKIIDYENEIRVLKKDKKGFTIKKRSLFGVYENSAQTVFILRERKKFSFLRIPHEFEHISDEIIRILERYNYWYADIVAFNTRIHLFKVRNRDMKYIIFKDKNEKRTYVSFPYFVNHDEIAGCLKEKFGEPDSAGQMLITHDDKGRIRVGCFGNSLTLGIGSKGEEDAKFIALTMIHK